MKLKTMFCGVLLVCWATEALAAVGDPTGTTYGVSGRDLGLTDVSGNGIGTFGAALLYESEYAGSDNDLTGDEQLGAGTPIPLTFDGVEEIVGNLAFNEAHHIFPGTGMVVSNLNFGGGAAFPLPHGWDTPGHLVEFSIRDTLGPLDEMTFTDGGIYTNIFGPNILRIDDVNLNTPNAVPVFAADRAPTNPIVVPPEAEGIFDGMYFYFRKGGLPANPTGVNDLLLPVFTGDHPTIPGQKIFVPAGDWEQFDEDFSHDIGYDTFSVNVDMERDAGGLNFSLMAIGQTAGNGGLGMEIDELYEIDEIVMGYLYRMIADGDGNEDALVNGSDYIIWANAYLDVVTNPAPPDEIGPAPGRTFNPFLGDYNSDGVVNGSDYIVWANNYNFVGDGSDLLPATAVPEPSSLMGLVTGLMALCGLMRRRSRG